MWYMSIINISFLVIYILYIFEHFFMNRGNSKEWRLSTIYWLMSFAWHTLYTKMAHVIIRELWESSFCHNYLKAYFTILYFVFCIFRRRFLTHLFYIRRLHPHIWLPILAWLLQVFALQFPPWQKSSTILHLIIVSSASIGSTA